MLQAQALTKRYGDYYALRGVSLTAEKGEIIGLLGRNGAGKSTLMNIITGYLSPTEGCVSLNGADIASEPAYVKARIGYLPEVPPLYADMTVDESLAFAAAIKRVPRARRKAEIDLALERADVTDHRARLVKHLSKGYRQRVGLAQATLGSPPVLILDEPSAGLDPTQIAQMRDVIREYAREHAVIVSSHILGEVSDLCSRIMVLDEGQVIACDTLSNLLTGGDGALVLRYPVGTPAIGALRALEDVDSAKALPTAEEGCEDALVVPKSDADIRAEVYGLFSRSGWTLYMLKPRETALEDVFRGLTDGAPREALL